MKFVPEYGSLRFKFPPFASKTYAEVLALPEQQAQTEEAARQAKIAEREERKRVMRENLENALTEAHTVTDTLHDRLRGKWMYFKR